MMPDRFPEDVQKALGIRAKKRQDRLPIGVTLALLMMVAVLAVALGAIILQSRVLILIWMLLVSTLGILGGLALVFWLRYKNKKERVEDKRIEDELNG